RINGGSSSGPSHINIRHNNRLDMINDLPFCLATKSNTVLNRKRGNSSYENDPNSRSNECFRKNSCQGCNVRPAIFAASIASKPREVSGVNLRSGFVHKRGVVLPSLLRFLTAFPLEIVNRVHLHTFTQAQPFTT